MANTYSKTEPLVIPSEVPAIYGDFFTLDEYQKLVRNSRLSDTERHAVLQLVSKPGAKTDFLVCPVAIDPKQPEWVTALMMVPDNPAYCRITLTDVKIGTLRKWKLARYDDWQPTGENIAEYAEHSRMFFD